MVDSTHYLLLHGRGHARVEFDAATVERECHHVVVADGEDHVEELLVGEPRGQLLPRRIADPRVVVKLVCGAQQGGIVVAPPTVVDSQLGALHLGLADVAPERYHGVLAELVVRRAAPTGAQDQQLAIARCQ